MTDDDGSDTVCHSMVRTYSLSCFLADLGGRRLSLGSCWLCYLLLLLLNRYRRLTRGRFAGRRLRRRLLSLAGLLAPSRALRWGRARRSLGCLLGAGADHGRRSGLLLNCRLCLWLYVSLGHGWHDCCCCCTLCSCSWLHRLSWQNMWQNLSCLISCKAVMLECNLLVCTCFCGVAAWFELFCEWMSGSTEVCAFCDCRAAAGWERSKLTPVGCHRLHITQQHGHFFNLNTYTDAQKYEYHIH